VIFQFNVILSLPLSVLAVDLFQ